MTKRRLSSEVFYWDAPSRELHKRDLFPLQIEIAGKKYTAPKWTIEHFKLVDFQGALSQQTPQQTPQQISKQTTPQKIFTVKPIIRFRDFNIQFETTAKLLHYDANKRELIARFENIPEEHRELLHYFSEALETGDMVNIDSVLRRVDMPVTPATTQLKEAQPATKSFGLKRAFFTGIYLLLGTALLLFTLSALYNKFTQIEVESAFVSTPVIPIQSPYQGSIEEMLIAKGNIIKQGQPLLTLDTSNNVALPTTYKLDAAKQQLVLYQALIKEKKGKSKQQSRIRSKKLKAAKSALTAAQTTRTLKCNRRYESEIDRRNPQKRNAECNAARVKVTSAKSRVSSEREALYAVNQQAKDSNVSVQVLKEKIKQAELKVEALENQPQVNTGKEILFSNASGKILNLIEDRRQYVKKGQIIAILQQSNSQPQIEAFVTQEQAAELHIGDTAKVKSPALNDDLPVIIKQIDYTENDLTTPNRKLFHWAVPKKNSAKVTLGFVNNHLGELPFGLPVELSIQKNSFNASGNASPNNNTAKKKQSAKNSSLSSNNAIFATAYADTLATPDAPSYCKNKQRLFPQSVIQSLKNNPDDAKIAGVLWKKSLLKKAKRLLKSKPNALASLHSAGITDSKNKLLKKTRVALRDANNTAILAFAFFLSNNQSYLQKAKQNLFFWAKIYQPNGHPIDETKLEGFLWAYDLLRCYYTWDEQKTINNWLEKIQQQKQQWTFGPTSTKNNFRTHQLKILLMLDRLLDDKKSLQVDQNLLEIHAKNNLLAGGETLDYKERDALHYHVYDLEAWQEIALLEPQYKAQVNQAYEFLIEQIQAGNIHNQFVNSKQKIDKKRAKGGFKYAKKGSSYDTKKITRSVITRHTLNHSSLKNAKALRYLSAKKVKDNLFYLSRYFVW